MQEVFLRIPDFAALQGELESSLIQNGLYPKEAQAMIATWRDVWFEEGSAQSARVFAGRMELITAATERTVAYAIHTNDSATLERYSRFLGPVTKRLLAKTTNTADKARLLEFRSRSVDSALYLDSGSRCKRE